MKLFYFPDDNIVMVDDKTIIVTDVTDEQVYTCRATNVLGVAETKFVVKTIDRFVTAISSVGFVKLHNLEHSIIVLVPLKIFIL